MHKYCLILFIPLAGLRGETYIELDPFVTVARDVQGFGQTLGTIETRESKPIDLASVLSRQVPAVALSRRGPMAGDLVLRGLSRDNVLITVDSNKTYCACPNRMDPPAFHVSSQQIEGVTIRSGPFSLEQGSTVGGAIAVRTRPAAQEPTGEAYLFGGGFNYLAIGLAGGGSLMDSALSSQGGIYYQEGGVYRDGDGVRFTELPGTNYRPEYRDVQAFGVLDAELKGSWAWRGAGWPGSATDSRTQRTCSTRGCGWMR